MDRPRLSRWEKGTFLIGWTLGCAGLAAGVYGDFTGLWADRPFAAGLLVNLAAFAMGFPIAALIFTRLNDRIARAANLRMAFDRIWSALLDAYGSINGLVNDEPSDMAGLYWETFEGLRSRVQRRLDRFEALVGPALSAADLVAAGAGPIRDRDSDRDNYLPNLHYKAPSRRALVEALETLDDGILSWNFVEHGTALLDHIDRMRRREFDELTAIEWNSRRPLAPAAMAKIAELYRGLATTVAQLCQLEVSMRYARYHL